MEKEKKITKWIHLFLPSLILAMTGTVFYGFVSGCRFMGILLWGLALICGVYGFLGIWKRWKAARIAAGSLSLVLALVLVAAVITLIPILQGPGETGENGEYVIVLGAGVRGTEPSEILADRIQMAARYLQEHPDVICIASGGMGNDENISEAQCIYDHLTALGIDGSRIWLEDRATSTIENFRYSIALIEEKTGKAPEQITVLSNEFHLYRASRMAEDCGLEADFIAAPTSKPLIRISYTIREIFALWKYLTIGG